MQHSTARILTTHTGSLPRPAALVQTMEGHDQREVRAHPGFTSQVQAAVAAAVRHQADVGIDVLTDGEMSKVAFSAYVTERVTGFDGPPRPPAPQIEPRLFPEYYQTLPPVSPGFRACNGPITWRPGDITSRRAGIKLPQKGAEVQCAPVRRSRCRHPQASGQGLAHACRGAGDTEEEHGDTVPFYLVYLADQT